MKNSPLRLALFAGMFIAFFIPKAFCQQPANTCWDFEEACGNPADAFFTGCIANAQSANGSPDTQSDYFGITAFSGSKYAHMYANQCYAGNGDPNIFHTEGIILRHNFVAGSPVKISFAVRSFGTQAPTETKVILVNNMPNFGGLNPGQGCLNPLDILPNIPAGSETITTIPKSGISGTQWQLKTFVWTPQSNFNQIWFRPKAFSQNPTQEVQTLLYLDKVCIEDLCPPLSYSTSICQYPGSDQAVIKINGSIVNQSDWALYSLPTCTPLFSYPAKLAWLSQNEFKLPINTGCYMLVGNTVPYPGCPSQQFMFIISTSSEGIPLCDGPCDDWQLSMTLNFCTEVSFDVLPDPGAPPLPPTALITFVLDGNEVQSGTLTNFTAPLSGPKRIASGWHEMCVWVEQPGCPLIEECYSFYIDCFEGPSDDRASSGQTKGIAFAISNPASGSIWMSAPFETGSAYLYSMQGALVKSFELNGTDRLDVSDLTTGQYILSIKSQGFAASKLVFVQN